MDSLTIQAAINPQRTRAAEVVPTLGQVWAVLLVSAIEVQHVIYVISLFINEQVNTWRAPSLVHFAGFAASHSLACDRIMTKS
jgi:hypothetical protein